MAISINQHDIAFLGYMQDKSALAFIDAADVFPEKSLLSLKRSAANINYYLGVERIVVTSDSFTCDISYAQYLSFLNNIQLKDYHSSVDERIRLIILGCFLYSVVNTSKLYAEIGISLTTRKKDLKALAAWLLPKGLCIEVVNRKGIRMVGDEVAWRSLVMGILASICELSAACTLEPRAANDAYERLMYSHFSHKAAAFPLIAEDYTQLIDENHLDLSWAARKLLYIWLLLARIRFPYYPVRECQIPLVIVQNIHAQPDAENQCLNYFIASLDHKKKILNVIDIALYQLLQQVFSAIQQQIVTPVLCREELLQEMYIYVHKCIIRGWFCFTLFDNNLAGTDKHYPNLFAIVSAALCPVAERYNVCFDNNQIATLTLIVRKYINNSKIAGRNKKSIVIVTNSAIEKIDFFIVNLTSWLDVTVLAAINIHEKEKLSDYPCDIVLTFSGRISLLLQQMNIHHIQVNYHLSQKDINNLLQQGCSSNHNRKINTPDFLAAIAGKSAAEISALLHSEYGNYFS